MSLKRSPAWRGVAPKRPTPFTLVLILLSFAWTACSGTEGGSGGNAGSGGGGGVGGGTVDGAPAIRSFRSTPRGLPAGGDDITLSWEVDGADTVGIEGIGTVTGSSAETSVTETTTFVLSATNDEGTSTASTTVLVASANPVRRTHADAETSLDEIAAALDEGAINSVDALRYKVFAFFGDPRLPAELEAPGRIHGTPILKELAARFSSLPMDVQTELRPFMIAPDTLGSWYQAAARGTQRIAKGGPPPWERVTIAGGDAQVLWESTFPERSSDWVENSLAPVIAGAYEELVSLMGRKPIPHTGNLSDPFRIFVVDTPDTAVGVMISETFDSDLGGYPSHVQINLGAIIKEDSTLMDVNQLSAATAAHEIMHAVQNAFDTVEFGTQALNWLEESTATWAEDYVYPFFNTEHVYASTFMDSPGLALDNLQGLHEYSGYLLHLFGDRQFEPSIVRGMWERTEAIDVIASVVGAFPLDWDEVIWPRFTAYNWNRAPVRFHLVWDDLEAGVADDTMKDPVVVNATQEVYEMNFFGVSDVGPTMGQVDYLSAQYYHYDLTDPSVHGILFANGFSFELLEGAPDLSPGDITYYARKLTDEELNGAHVQVLVKANGEWMEDPIDVTEVAFVPFCQDYEEERIEELVVIFSNSRWAEGEKTPISVKGLSPRLFATNFACGDWVGEARSDIMVVEDDRLENTTVDFQNMLFSRTPESLERLLGGSGSFEILDQIFPTDAAQQSVVRYNLEIADIDWTTMITDFGTNTCMSSGSGSMDVSDAMLTLFEIRPTVTGPTGNDLSIYRSFFTNLLFFAPGAPVTRTCEMGPPSSEGFITAFFGGRRNLEIGTVLIEPDGVQINEAWTLDEQTFQLNLLGISD